MSAHFLSQTLTWKSVRQILVVSLHTPLSWHGFGMHRPAWVLHTVSV